QDDPVSSREPASTYRVDSGSGAWLVRLGSSELLLPAECACCGAPSVREARLSDGAKRELLVGYCEACATHVAGEATRRLSAAARPRSKSGRMVSAWGAWSPRVAKVRWRASNCACPRVSAACKSST